MKEPKDIIRHLDFLYQFERHISELKHLGGFNEVVNDLKGNGRDTNLIKKLAHIQANAANLQKLSGFWSDDGLTEVRELKRVATGHLSKTFNEIFADSLEYLSSEDRLTGLPDFDNDYMSIYRSKVLNRELIDNRREDLSRKVDINALRKNLPFYTFICLRHLRDINSDHQDWKRLYNQLEKLKRAYITYSRSAKEVNWKKWLNGDFARLDLEIGLTALPDPYPHIPYIGSIYRLNSELSIKLCDCE
jgi:hypothetical protein